MEGSMYLFKQKVIFIFIICISAICIVSCEKQDIDAEYQITFFQTGKSDCILIEADELVILCDTADEDDYYKIADALREKNINQIDYLILSHFDKDHIGSATKIVENFPVSCAIMPDYKKDSKLYISLMAALETQNTDVRRLTTDELIEKNDVKILIEAPKRNFYEDENNYSLITTVTCKNTSFLLMGDALKQRTEEFMEGKTFSKGQYQVVKLPHHGDYNKALKNFISSVAPFYAVITEDNNQERVEEKLIMELEQQSCDIFYTFQGDIVID